MGLHLRCTGMLLLRPNAASSAGITSTSPACPGSCMPLAGGGVQHERLLDVHLEAVAEELSDRTTDEFHSEAGSIAHGTGGHGGSSDGSGGGGGRREAQKQHKEVKARQSAQGGGEK